jgi:anti-sigma regulatory factor (Ser/Thr protein kinase)
MLMTVPDCADIAEGSSQRLNGEPRAPGEAVSYLELAALPSAPAWARRQTRSALLSWHLGSDVIDTAELLVSELVTNSVKFTGTYTAQVSYQELRKVSIVSLTLRHLADRLIIEVYDPDPRPPVLTEPDSEAESGRGLMLVQMLSKEWSYYQPPSGGKVVYCILASQDAPDGRPTSGAGDDEVYE